jgi:maleylpyruvate isomerase
MTEAATFTEVIDAIREQTAHLLGTTISYDEKDWADATALPGWTRSHVAAHLVEGAERMLGLLRRIEDTPGTPLHTSPEDDQRALERRALDAGLTLQIQFDETAGQLQRALSRLEHDDRIIGLSDAWQVPAHSLPLVRLREVVIHHFDLIGHDAISLPDNVLRMLFEVEVDHADAREFPPMLLLADEGFSARIGPDGGETTTAIGPVRDLLVWLARGVTSPHISGLPETGRDTPVDSPTR